MSRFGAALGSAIGLVGGGMVGTYIGHSLSPRHKRKVSRIGGAPPSQSLGAIGALSGTAIGAIIGAGSGGGTTPGALGWADDQVFLGGASTSGFALNGGSEVWEIGFRLTNPAGVRTLPTPDEWSKLIGGALASVSGVPYADGTMQVQATFVFNDTSKVPGDNQPTYMFPSGIYATVNNKKFVGPSGLQAATSASKLSTAEVAGLAALGAVGVGGIIYAATRGPKRRRRR